MLAFLGLGIANAQIGIGTTSPDASAILEVESTTKGFLPPRMDTDARGSINSPAEGLVIYNTDEKCLQFFDGSLWIDLCDDCVETVWSFTNCGKTGRFGPSQTECNSSYSNTNLEGNVTISTQGIQEWIVPSTGLYRMTVAGAQGGPYTNSDGEGAIIQADVTLTGGQSIKILVGQHGLGGSSYPRGFSGGGSFVTFSNNTPILVAGGGGNTFSSSGTLQQVRGQTTMLGATAGATPNAVANGGNTSNNSGAGGGLNTDGAGTGDAGGKSFINGGIGGYSSEHEFIEGGFGGGGVRSGGYGEGCGGGYSGGNGGTTTSSWQGGAGGGSFIISTAENIYTSDGQFESSTTFNGGSIQNLNQYNSNNGYVSIEKICP